MHLLIHFAKYEELIHMDLKFKIKSITIHVDFMSLI